MNLTAVVVAERLKKHYSGLNFQIHTRGALGRPLLYEPGVAPGKGHFYVLTGPVEEPENADGCCFLSGNWIRSCGWSGSYICMESPRELFNAVQRLFDELDAWEKKLTELRENQRGIRDLLEFSYPIFDNPLAVLGRDFSIIADVGVDGFKEGEALFYPGPERMELINALKQDERYNRMQDQKGVVWYPDHIVGFNSWNMIFTPSDSQRYRLILMEHKNPLSESDRYLLELLGHHIEMVLRAGASNRPGGENLRAIFHRVLSDRTADYMEISHKLSNLGWGAEDEYLCMVYQTTYLDQKNLTANAICEYMEEQIPYTCSFPFKDDVVSFFDLTLAQLTAEEVGNRLKYFIRESFLKAGYSRVMKGHSNLRRQYVQSTIALDVGGRKKPYLWIHWFDQIAFVYILEQCSRRLPGNMLCHEKLPLLRAVDEQQNTEYYHTLQVYLEENLNATQTARRLFIHRSTFLYRLERIREILESDLMDPEELLYLNFSFRLLEQEDQKSQEKR